MKILRISEIMITICIYLLKEHCVVEPHLIAGRVVWHAYIKISNQLAILITKEYTQLIYWILPENRTGHWMKIHAATKNKNTLLGDKSQIIKFILIPKVLLLNISTDGYQNVPRMFTSFQSTSFRILAHISFHEPQILVSKVNTKKKKKVNTGLRGRIWRAGVFPPMLFF